MKIILASKSPRRFELLTMLGHDVKVIVSDVDESVITESDSRLLCRKLSELKAKSVYNLNPNSDLPIIASDTVVDIDGKILGKPKNFEDARAMLDIMNGRTHSVYSGYCVIYKGKQYSGYEGAEVTFRYLSDKEIIDYITSSEPYDKAGAYGIQGQAGAFVEKISGDYFSIVGLPICKITTILNEITNEEKNDRQTK